MTPSEILNYKAPKVVGVDDADPDGHIPLELLLKGIEVVVPIWPVPSPDGRTDTLIVQTKRNGVVEFAWSKGYVNPISEREFIIPIGPQYLAVDGVIELHYETRNFVNNPAYSDPRKLTIDHMPVVRELPEARFPGVDHWGYLNCSTVPPIWEGIEIEVPPLPAFTKNGDRCVVEWVGYKTLNASGPPIDNTYLTCGRDPLTDADIRDGYGVTIGPFVPHIEPMINNASATVVYSIYRGDKLIGLSKAGIVKIDRMIPGEVLPCGP
ncbi:hypothetical protein PS718_03351 [Pseudomonas fluorescens]|uniref:Uncharacterized protein n=2 Tax=Pseudomonas fluorescens TaxID=294 RepID=A0A5E7DNS5_PSEFL|nr:hypothetical protein PS718_03351 [Pseudomonas fluorescens]